MIVPFAGGAEAASDLRSRFAGLVLRPEDELVVADYSVTPAFVDDLRHRVVVVDGERSPGLARNAGSEEALSGWLLFVDAEAEPDARLIDAFFRKLPSQRTGIIAGAGAGEDDESVLETSGCLLVRRETWESLGGFQEGVRWGEVVELCWRAQDAGWQLELRPDARARRRQHETVGDRFRFAVREGAARLWLRRRFPDRVDRPRLVRRFARSIAAAMIASLSGRFDAAKLSVTGAAGIAGNVVGWYLGSNKLEGKHPAVRRKSGGDRAPITMLTDAFPARSETFVYNEVRELRGRGRPVRVESSVRPAKIERSVARDLDISYLEDDAPRRKLVDLVWITTRHPLRCIADVRDRARWSEQERPWSLAAIAPAARRIASGGERHLHAHFAAGAALHALRIARLLDLPYSVTAHAYDLFQQPRNLQEKLAEAAFVVGECDYTLEYMRSVAGEDRPKFHRQATGVYAERFRRTHPHPGTGRVVAVGRHVEKKGFSVLVEAASLLRGDDALALIEIAGEGPLRPQLERQIEELGLTDVVRLRGNVWGADGVSAFLENADALVISAVPAKDGDRDALPVISYEALAMEVPIVASDFVGLPEVVRPPWGRVVPPGDATALATAIRATLELSPEARARAGQQGRAWVIEHADPRREVGKLDALFEAAIGNRDA